MSHVDEGTLHAYLDGELPPAEARGVEAHVAECAACRDRLEEERALIARADELLGLAAPPDRATSPFNAGDLKPPARLWSQVRLPLAWAATVMLALGIGMYLGGGAAMGRREEAATNRPADLAVREPAIGAAIIVLEQALDSSTVIELRERVAAASGLVAVARDAAEERDALRERAAAKRVQRLADSIAVSPRAQRKVVPERNQAVV